MPTLGRCQHKPTLRREGEAEALTTICATARRRLEDFYGCPVYRIPQCSVVWPPKLKGYICLEKKPKSSLVSKRPVLFSFGLALKKKTLSMASLYQTVSVSFPKSKLPKCPSYTKARFILILFLFFVALNAVCRVYPNLFLPRAHSFQCRNSYSPVNVGQIPVVPFEMGT